MSADSSRPIVIDGRRNIQTNHAKLRVGVVTTSFPNVGHVSSGVFVERLVAHLPQTVAATVLTPGSDREFVAQPNVPYRLECFTYGPRAWMRLAHRPGGIPDALRRRDPAVLLLPLLLPAMFIACLRLAGRTDILHGNWSVPSVIAAIAARLRGRAAVATLRGEDITRAESSRLFRWILSLCLALNHRTVVVSEAMREALSRRYPRWRSRIEFIPNGVSMPEVPARAGFHVPLRLVVVASLIQRKRISTLVRAMAELAETLDPVLRVVGDGAQWRELRALANDLGVAHRVEFMGGVPPEEVEPHLRWADIFVFASESEGRPNAVLEAMAAGLPVVATDIPGVRELIGRNAGLLFPVGDESALVRCVTALVDDTGRAREMAHKARQRIEENDLTWEAAGRRYAALYSTTVKGEGARSCAD